MDEIELPFVLKIRFTDNDEPRMQSLIAEAIQDGMILDVQLVGAKAAEASLQYVVTQWIENGRFSLVAELGTPSFAAHGSQDLRPGDTWLTRQELVRFIADNGLSATQSSLIRAINKIDFGLASVGRITHEYETLNVSLLTRVVTRPDFRKLFYERCHNVRTKAYEAVTTFVAAYQKSIHDTVGER